MNIRQSYNIIRRERDGQKVGCSYVDFNKNGKVDFNEPSLRISVDHAVFSEDGGAIPNGLDKALAKFRKTGKLEMGTDTVRKHVKFSFAEGVHEKMSTLKNTDQVFNSANNDGTRTEMKSAKLTMNQNGEGRLTVNQERN